MSGPWLVSYIVLWSLVILEAVTIAALARQVGLLDRRLPAVGARTTGMGPPIGEQVPRLGANDLYGSHVSLHADDGTDTLAVFLSTSCSVCAQVVPSLQAIARRERDLRVLAIFLDDHQAVKEYASVHGLNGRIRVVPSAELGDELNVTGTPYGMTIDKSGTLRAKGIADHVEHLESLLNALTVSKSSNAGGGA